MTVVTVSTSGVKRYIGLTADVKPTTNTPIGSTYIDIQTGIEYIFDGTIWGAITGLAAAGSATEATLLALAASASVLDDWDETDRAKVNIIAGQVGVAAGAGIVTALTQRTTLASDDPGVASLTAIAASASVLDDWDETDRAKVNIIAGQVGVAAGAGAVTALTQRTTLASDDPGVASLALIAASASVLDDWDETDRAKVNTIAGQVGVQGGAGAVTALTQRVIQADRALTMTHSTGAATTSTSAMLAVNAARLYALLINDGSVDVYIKIGVAAVVSQGIRLTPNGGSYEMSAALGNLATGAINGITASGAATVLVTEGA